MKKPSRLKPNKIFLSGWATKEFSIEELKDYLCTTNPLIFEISKDFVDGNVSIKKIHGLLMDYRKSKDMLVSYAGTTDFIDCSGLSFEEYSKYLAIQASQAKFLDSDFFRVLIGGNPDSNGKILERLASFAKMIAPAKIVIEIHKGWESSIKNIKRLIEKTDYDFVIDFQNLLESNLSFKKLNGMIPKERIAYYHCRNLDSYTEDKISLPEEKEWIDDYQKNKLLWEPKMIKKEKILELMKWT
ncbi:MAG: hypothetical protein ACP5NZ_02090 [Nanobdellota archaeon]